LGEQEHYRYQVFAQNLEYIRRHNEAADAGNHTYWLGINQFADMTNDEFRLYMNGYIQRMLPSGNAVHVPRLAVQDLPAAVNWTAKGFVTPVKNQKQCGSCWAFSTTGSLEGAHFNSTKKLVSLSEQNLVDCSKKEGNKGCQGGLMDNAFMYIKKKGIDTEESYPYKGRQGRCHYKKANVGATLTSWTDVKSGSEADLQSAVAEIGPISVAIDAGHQSFQLYKHGVYVEPKCSSKLLDHGVLATGYGTLDGKDYWLVKNSWSPKWGIDGYIMMARNHKNMCGIATQASYPIV